MEVKINDKSFDLVENYKDGFDKEVVEEKMTEFFDEYDYIFGDWAYGKVRLKGFNDSNNKNVNKINDIKNLEDYKTNNCAYDCKYFLLKRK
jgi:uncharacterized protein YutD